MDEENKIVLGIMESDVPILLDAIENLHEEIDASCKKMKCEACSPIRAALVRLKLGILLSAPLIKYPRS